MSLPQQNDIDRMLSERPGDELFPKVRHYVEQINEKEETLKEKLVSLILDDMIQDQALANSFDRIGEVLEYLAQDRQIEKPEFTGEILMRNFSRISKLKLSLEYAKLINLEDDVLEAVIKAEIERLWQGDSNTALLKQLLLNKAASSPTPSPVNFPPVYKKEGGK